MSRYLVLIAVLYCINVVSQEELEFSPDQNHVLTVVSEAPYQGTKSTAYIKKRSFDDALDSKYSGSDFTYTEKEDVPEDDTLKKEPAPVSDSLFFTKFLLFMTSVFPYLLGLLVVYIIVRVLMGSDLKFWKYSKTTKIKGTGLTFEEEEEFISATDFDALLKRAVALKDFRLATRYHYLATLKKLADKELIKYHIEKTNAAYIYELKNKSLRARFSYLSYIYNYVWYGEFSIDAQMFKK